MFNPSQLQFENYLRKLAVESLKIPTDEYETLNEERDQEWIIDELQRRSLEQNVSAYDLRALRESLLRDHDLVTRTHNQWQPPEVRSPYCTHRSRVKYLTQWSCYRNIKTRNTFYISDVDIRLVL